MKSIIQSKSECFICKTNYDVETTKDLTEHLIFNDYPKQSNKDLYPSSLIVVK